MFIVCIYSFQRPLLVILDRNVDLATPLHHTWTYQALAHDVLVGSFVVNNNDKFLMDVK
jgi:hypothetical protein